MNQEHFHVLVAFDRRKRFYTKKHGPDHELNESSFLRVNGTKSHGKNYKSKWWNDQLINGIALSYFPTLKEFEGCYIVDSFFFGNYITKYSYNDKGYKTELISTSTKVLVPINWNNFHWALTVIFLKLKKVVYYDSLSNVEATELKQALFGPLLFLKEQHEALERDFKIIEWELVHEKVST